MSGELLSNPVDHVLIAGVKTPGLAEVVGARADYIYQAQPAAGMTGERVKFLRREMSEFEVRIRCFESDELIYFDELIRPLLKLPEKSAYVADPSSKEAGFQALDIWHPHLEDLGIKSVVVKSVSQFERVDDTGIWQVTIKFRQFVAIPTPSLKTKVTEVIAAPRTWTEELIDRLRRENEAMSQESAGPIPPPLPTP